jgi:hypothetical protein
MPANDLPGNTFVRSVQVLVSSEDPSHSTPSDRQDLPRLISSAAARELLLELIDAGATHLVLVPVPPYPSVQWLADESIEPVLTELSVRRQS